MMGTDSFLWIGIADPYSFPDTPFVTRSFADPDPLFLTRSRSDRRLMIAILPITGYSLP